MTEPKLISPMLDNFSVGGAISEHNGVRCFPAIDNSTDERYIIKTISLPAAQEQMDALLFSGAYPDTQSALAYFKTLADGIVKEVQVLERLSTLEGFVPFKAYQTVDKEDQAGFDVYLLGTYKKTLQRYMRKNPMTHLGAINLGLDLCAAMSVCRNSGYLYVDLKPENIIMNDENSFSIADLGFVKLSSLKYATLPDRYRSTYTAPELNDSFAVLNTTVDIYAIGLILYQVYNDGILPVRSEDAPAEDFLAPAYADYEMAEIILKACAADPDSRWQSPAEMGQALVSYMQRNGANDTPITPVVENEPGTTYEPDEATKNSSDDVISEETADSDTATVEDEIGKDDENEEISIEDDSDADILEISEESIYTDDGEGNLTFITNDSDETLPDNDNDDMDDIEHVEITEEVSDMLDQADELISHPTPDPVMQPEPIDVPIPDPIIEEEPENNSDDMKITDSEASDDEQSQEQDADTLDDPESEVADSEEDELLEEPKSSRSGHWLRNVIIAIIAVGILIAGFFFYKNYYLQPIESIVLEESDLGVVTVLITTKIDESKLLVVCADTYGNQLSAPVKDGRAVITGLAPNSAYTVKVMVNGFHKLTGDTSTAFTTPTQTNIVQLRAVTGSEDGSAVVSFTIDGPDASQWKVNYVTDGEEAKEVVFSGHMTTLTGLTVGSNYTISLSPVDELHITGIDEIKHTARTLVKAENLMIVSCADGKLTVQWSVLEGTVVESWTVRCYSDNGYDETIVVNDTTAVFEVASATEGYTVEVTAEGMSVNERAFAAANSVTVSGFVADDSDENSIKLSWNANGFIPEGGWKIQYSYDGCPIKEVVCDATDSSATIEKIPATTYKIILLSADGTSILGGTIQHTVSEGKSFEGYNLTSEQMNFKMCKTPSIKKWDRHDLKESDYTDTFISGEKASFLIHSTRSYRTSKDMITALFVIRDENGNIVSTDTSSSTWKSMWKKNYCELDIPALPNAAGKYSISVYFNGMLAHNQEFTISE